ncbi:vegetative cell wall protein gp1-like [Zingiber officinale]|uniref:vegetative cell wall protein gp1-like n=1 Tax=Zingiber officinale TaxID=94328 RepID=UPI001C4BC56D|nr:vegetative cell wall protein gp1-like [Zingiber officinale]
MEIMRRGRVILERRALPHSSSTSIDGASLTNPPLRPAQRGSSAARPSLLAPPTHSRTARAPRSTTPARPWAARPPRPATPVRPQAPARPRAPCMVRPTPPTPLPSVTPLRAPYILGQSLGGRPMGLGRRTGNVSLASPAFRDASQAARRARAINERLSQNTPTPSRHRARSSSDDSDSDDQPLSQRRRRRAPHPMSDPVPSSIPSPLNAAASPTPPQATPPSIPSHVADPPTLSSNQAEPPLVHPATSQNVQDNEAGPSERPSTIPSAMPHQGPSSTPFDTTVEPSAPPGSAAGPSGPPPLIYQNYYITLPSEAPLWSQTDVPTSSLKIKGHLATLWEESLWHMNSLPPPAQMDQFAELYVKACAESLIMNHSFHATHYQNKMLRDHVAELELQLNDPAQANHVGHRFSTSAIYMAGGALRQLHEQEYLMSLPPPEFLDHDRIIKEIPDEIFAPFD